MRRCLLIFAAVLALQTFAQAQTASESSPVTFNISSVKTAFALAGNFEGEYRLKDDSIQITLSNAEIFLRDNCPYKGRRMLSFINVALMTMDASGKRTVLNHAFAIPLGETMKPGDKYVANKLRFSIPRDSNVDLTKCWLVVEMGELSLDSDREDKVGYAFAQSERDIFAGLLANAAKK